MAVPLGVGAAMLAVAQLEPSVVFPEAVALASGIWIFANREWAASRWRLALVVPASAAAGLALARTALRPWQSEIIVLTAVLAGLFLLRCRLAPAISASMIPSVFAIHSWIYPLSVLVICLVLAGGLELRVAGRGWCKGGATERRGATERSCTTPGGAGRSSPEPGGAEKSVAGRGDTAAGEGRWHGSHLGLVWLVGSVLVVGTGFLHHLPPGVLAPPMFVSLTEAVGGPWPLQHVGGSRRTLLLRWSSMVLGATMGAVVVGELGSGWLAIALLVGAVWVMGALLVRAGIAHPPALSLALVPLLIAHFQAAPFIVGIAIGAAYLVGVGWLATQVTARALQRSRRRAVSTAQS